MPVQLGTDWIQHVTFEVVYLARHGQTQWNQEGRRQGQLDSPLTDAGQMHATDLGRLVTALDIDCVACSPIGRALATATVTAEALGTKPFVVDELAEVHHGDMAGLTNAEADARFPGMLSVRLADKYRWRFPGGESYADADERASQALARVASTGSRKPLIVSHEMIGRMLLRCLSRMPAAEALATKQPHHVVYRVDPQSGQVDRLMTAST